MEVDGIFGVALVVVLAVTIARDLRARVRRRLGDNRCGGPPATARELARAYRERRRDIAPALERDRNHNTWGN